MGDAIKQFLKFHFNEFQVGAMKVLIGLGGSITSITAAQVNIWIGIMAGIATFIYMCFQIEGAWHNRKNRDK